MLSALRSRIVHRPTASLSNVRRWLATETSMVVPSTNEGDESEEKQRQRYEEFLEQKTQEPPTRPQLNIAASPKHGLYGFFRQVPVDGGLSYAYETVESSHKPETKMGRSWNATELRRKSFKDLHTLWYIVLRERNLLATQRAESRRLGVILDYLDIQEKDSRCRKTMARIKQVLNERRLAYEQAYALDYTRYKEAEGAARAQKVQNPRQEDVEKATSPSSQTPTRGRKPRRAGRSSMAALPV